MEFDFSGSNIRTAGNVACGNVNIGNVNVNIQNNNNHPKSPSDLLLPTCNFPSKRFVGRVEELAQLESFFFGHTNIDQGEAEHVEGVDVFPVRQVYVVRGMAGCGKSQLCFRFVRTEVYKRFKEENIFFLDATSLQSIHSSLTTIGRVKCGAIEGPEDNVNPGWEAGLNWLSRCKAETFVFLDSADDLSVDLYHYLPRSTRVRVLITTQIRRSLDDYGEGRPGQICGLALDSLSYDDAYELFRDVIQPSDEEHVSKLINKLERHPLAIAQAAAVIKRMRIPVLEYLAELETLPEDELEANVQIGCRDVDGYPKTARTSWLMSYRKLPRMAHDISLPSTDLMDLCSFLHHIGIEEVIFQHAHTFLTADPPHPTFTDHPRQPALNLLENLLAAFSSPRDNAWSSLKFRSCIRAIYDYHLMEYSEDDGSYSMHSLIRSGLRAELCKDAGRDLQAQASFLVASAIRQAWDDDWALLKLLPHVGDLSPALDSFGEAHPDWLYSFARPYVSSGRDDLAAQYYRAAILGYKNPESEMHLRAQLEYAKTLKRLSIGSLEEARSILQKIRATSSLVNGENNELTDDIVSALAVVCTRLGETVPALRMRETVYEHRRDRLKDEHPSTLRARSLLAMSWSYTGQKRRALHEQQQVYDTMFSLYVSEDRRTIDTRRTIDAKQDLAGSLARSEQQIDREKALQYQREIASARAKHHGPTHLATLYALEELALTKSQFEDLRVEAKLEQAMVVKETIVQLGEKHHITIRAQRRLATILERQIDAPGDEEEALRLHSLVLAFNEEKKISDAHPTLITSISSVIRARDRIQRRPDPTRRIAAELVVSVSHLELRQPKKFTTSSACNMQLDEAQRDKVTAALTKAKTYRCRNKQARNALHIYTWILVEVEGMVGEANRTTLSLAKKVADILRINGDLRAAEVMLEKVVDILFEQNPRNCTDNRKQNEKQNLRHRDVNSPVLKHVLHLANIKQALGKHKEAEALCNTVWSGYMCGRDLKHWQLGKALEALAYRGASLVRLGGEAEGEDLQRFAVDGLERLESGRRLLVKARLQLLETLRGRGKDHEANELEGKWYSSDAGGGKKIAKKSQEPSLPDVDRLDDDVRSQWSIVDGDHRSFWLQIIQEHSTYSAQRAQRLSIRTCMAKHEDKVEEQRAQKESTAGVGRPNVPTSAVSKWRRTQFPGIFG